MYRFNAVRFTCVLRNDSTGHVHIAHGDDKFDILHCIIQRYRDGYTDFTVYYNDIDRSYIQECSGNIERVRSMYRIDHVNRYGYA